MFYKDGNITVSEEEALRVGLETPFSDSTRQYFISLSKKVLRETHGEVSDLWTVCRIATVFMAAGYIQGVRDERIRRRKSCPTRDVTRSA